MKTKTILASLLATAILAGSGILGYERFSKSQEASKASVPATAPVLATAQPKIPPYLNPAYMIAAPESIARERRSWWEIGGNGDLPFNPGRSVVFCIFAAIVAPFVVLFGYLRAARKEEEANAALALKLRAAGDAKIAAGKGIGH